MRALRVAVLRLGFSSGWTENYWAGWPWSRMYGGSENTLIEVACALAAKGHRVTVRLPYRAAERVWRGVRWVGHDHAPLAADALFCFDDYARRDDGARTLLVVTRSDPPRHTDFDQLSFWSRTHATLLGHPDRPTLGGGVRGEDYRTPLPRIARRVICTSSPDRCPAAGAIGRAFDFVHTYRPIPGFHTVECSREDLVRIQSTALVQIHPYDPARESEFFCMSVLEALAAGTPCVLSDGPALVELWSEAAIILPRPIDLGEWNETIEALIANEVRWRRHSRLGRKVAADYDWSRVADRYLKTALGDA